MQNTISSAAVKSYRQASEGAEPRHNRATRLRGFGRAITFEIAEGTIDTFILEARRMLDAAEVDARPPGWRRDFPANDPQTLDEAVREATAALALNAEVEARQRRMALVAPALDAEDVPPSASDRARSWKPRESLASWRRRMAAGFDRHFAPLGPVARAYFMACLQHARPAVVDEDACWPGRLRLGAIAAQEMGRDKPYSLRTTSYVLARLEAAGVISHSIARGRKGSDVGGRTSSIRRLNEALLLGQAPLPAIPLPSGRSPTPPLHSTPSGKTSSGPRDSGPGIAHQGITDPSPTFSRTPSIPAPAAAPPRKKVEKEKAPPPPPPPPRWRRPSVRRTGVPPGRAGFTLARHALGRPRPPSAAAPPSSAGAPGPGTPVASTPLVAPGCARPENWTTE